MCQSATANPLRACPVSGASTVRREGEPPTSAEASEELGHRAWFGTWLGDPAHPLSLPCCLGSELEVVWNAPFSLSFCMCRELKGSQKGRESISSGSLNVVRVITY